MVPRVFLEVILRTYALGILHALAIEVIFHVSSAKDTNRKIMKHKFAQSLKGSVCCNIRTLSCERWTKIKHFYSTR